MLWFEQRLKWWRSLILSWHVALESAKNPILRVNTPGQHVLSCVRYETSCLLIRNVIGCMCLARLSVDGLHSLCHLCYILCDLLEPHDARGSIHEESLALQSRHLMENP
jgi:hypothetical protein